MPPDPVYVCVPGGGRATFPDGVVLGMVRPEFDRSGRLWVEVIAHIGESVVNDARIDLLDQRHRLDYHAIAFARDGRIDWQSHLLSALPHVQAQLADQGTEAEGPDATTTPWARAIPAPSFLTQEDGEALWVVDNLVAPGAITGLMAPRGLGKTHVAHAMAIAVALGGMFLGNPLQPGKVMLVDRDNAPRELKRRLRGWGGRTVHNLTVLTRDDAPGLRDTAAWSLFPFAEYALVIIDSIGATTEGIGDNDVSETAKALATLLDLARKGPAVLLLGNTTKSGAHYRGSGAWADRLDLLYELRDATGFSPSGKSDWWHELPEAGEATFAARASRRKQRDTYRLAFVPSKFRLAQEPDPFCLEICLTDPWGLRDVTGEVLAAGDQARKQAALAMAAAKQEAIEHLKKRVAELDAAGTPLLKTDAEKQLQAVGVRRKVAREIIQSGDGIHWTHTPGTGPGHAIMLRPCVTLPGGINTTPHEPAPNKHMREAEFCRPLPEPTAKIDTSPNSTQSGLPGSGIDAADPNDTPSSAAIWEEL